MTKQLVPRTVVGAVVFVLLAAGVAFASQDIARREDLVCTVCHDKPGSKLLTDRGKYYELMGSLAGFAEVKASFEQCTACHVRKPGSHKLTKKGQHLAVLIHDMEGLREWVTGQHPGCETPEAEVGGNEPDDGSGPESRPEEHP